MVWCSRDYNTDSCGLASSVDHLSLLQWDVSVTLHTLAPAGTCTNAALKGCYALSFIIIWGLSALHSYLGTICAAQLFGGQLTA